MKEHKYRHLSAIIFHIAPYGTINIEKLMSTIHPLLKATLLNSNLYIPYIPVIVKKQTNSTNEDAKKLSNSYDALVIVAESQTKGKGRYTRSFQSNPYKGIYLSFIMKAKLDSTLLAKLSLICPLA
ncbi:MAG: hypothetical protein WCI62_04105, partial [Erysipelotrichaceae bacterium]